MAQKKAQEQMLLAEMPGVPGMKVNPKYEYDSDEDTEGGTWEHKQRRLEMDATRSEKLLCCEKTCLQGFRTCQTQTGLKCHRTHWLQW